MTLIAGVDEAGRGPLAGPVVAAAVILDPRLPIEGLRDSKQLTALKRKRLAREIRCSAVAFALGVANTGEIDTINILRASLLAMERAVTRLKLQPDLVLVDGNQLPAFAGAGRRFAVEAIIDGDETVPCISAPSILAKVCRPHHAAAAPALPGLRFRPQHGLRDATSPDDARAHRPV